MASSTLFSARFLVLIASILALSAQAFAQSTSSTASQPASTAVASIFPGTSPWSYYGCWNETTLITGTNGARALGGGVQEDLTTMTAELCMSFCKSNSFTFAGIEYTKECYCANYLNSLSSKLPDSSCDLGCAGNGTQICGGNLALTIYQQKSSTKGAGTKVVREAHVGSILALGIAIAVLLCLA
ncbi:WSC domain-containing protein [Hyaloscypha finlandica]|nr:WSC domain-containing protein [Hyaloscypha finlandica]KAH8814028.1 WSC domain-containing protein [Hyaloscypha sp. PMI_1271]